MKGAIIAHHGPCMHIIIYIIISLIYVPGCSKMYKTSKKENLCQGHSVFCEVCATHGSFRDQMWSVTIREDQGCSLPIQKSLEEPQGLSREWEKVTELTFSSQWHPGNIQGKCLKLVYPRDIQGWSRFARDTEQLSWSTPGIFRDGPGLPGIQNN